MRVRNLIGVGFITLAKLLSAKTLRTVEVIPEDRIVGWLLTDDSVDVFTDAEAKITERNTIGGSEGMPRMGLRVKIRFSDNKNKTLKVCGVTFKGRQKKLAELEDKEVRLARIVNKYDEFAMAVVLV